jgi:hypothetical protein
VSASDFETDGAVDLAILRDTLHENPLASSALARIEARMGELEGEPRLTSAKLVGVDAWDQLKDRAEHAEAEVGRLREALGEIADAVHVVKDAPDGQPVILVRRPEVALDAAIGIARAALQESAPAPTAGGKA